MARFNISAARHTMIDAEPSTYVGGPAEPRPPKLELFLSAVSSMSEPTFPAPVKRGIADAVVRLYNQRSFPKYDSARRGWRFADVIDFVHPIPSDDSQSMLFRHAIDIRHRHGESIPGMLRTLVANRTLRAEPPEAIITMASDGRLADRLAVFRNDLGGGTASNQRPMTAELWEAIIPSMGAMALPRNLRNFDVAGIGPAAASLVAERLTGPNALRGARVLPMRVLSAYRHASAAWYPVLENALDEIVGQLPALDGTTLILIDRSGSMFCSMSGPSELTYADVAALFGTVLASDAMRRLPSSGRSRGRSRHGGRLRSSTL